MKWAALFPTQLPVAHVSFIILPERMEHQWNEISFAERLFYSHAAVLEEYAV